MNYRDQRPVARGHQIGRSVIPLDRDRGQELASLLGQFSDDDITAIDPANDTDPPASLPATGTD
jgi:hypothetical protein